MNKILFTFLISISFVAVSFGQDLEKIKGDRNVTVKQTYLNPFNKIVVGNEFSIQLIYNTKSSVEIETDENLHDVIKFNVTDNTLVFTTTHRITSSKKMNITVNYSTPLQLIEVNNEAEIRSLTSLELKDVTLKTNDEAKAYLNINANNFVYQSTGKSKTKLNVTAKTAKIELSDNSKLEALVNANEATIDLYQRTIANIEGDVIDATLRIDNNADFNGKNFTAQTGKLISELESDAYVNFSKSIIIEAAGNSEVYLYGEPQITINRFADAAKLQKK